jgi:hypothetical protein
MLHVKGQKTLARDFDRWSAQTHIALMRATARITRRWWWPAGVAKRSERQRESVWRLRMGRE